MPVGSLVRMVMVVVMVTRTMRALSDGVGESAPNQCS